MTQNPTTSDSFNHLNDPIITKHAIKEVFLLVIFHEKVYILVYKRMENV